MYLLVLNLNDAEKSEQFSEVTLKLNRSAYFRGESLNLNKTNNRPSV